MILFSDSELSLASEEISRLKESLSASERFRVIDAGSAIDDQNAMRSNYEKEISRLKAENERLRRALSELYDVVFKGENVFKSLDKAHEVLNKPNITIVQSKNK